MKSTYDRMLENLEFVKFTRSFEESANYFMAKSGDERALRLCLAYAFCAGLEAKQGMPDTSIERDECGVETQSSWSRRQVDTNALPYAEVKRRLEGLTRAAWRVMHHWNIFKEPSLKEVMAELSYAVQDADAQITAPAEGDNHGA